ncbi:LysR family transcriptional regulator [Brevibacterium sp. UCMA 11752]|uniref:LysR family transcriptional regulator n=1 Tax=Brevibacterium sp. UCMA 11752 TaxID=2745946 RepID=UPI001F25FA32|nr:LysR family transcriptional regulator [Brevibacterium sp. UCMA 11752]MCF2588663.1 LysR family transcriptional regulator [Brevibacterium sp. UCMA 11752]
MDARFQSALSTVSFTHVRALRAVVEHGSLSSAAKDLGYTTSAISQQISALERSLGVSLFERGPRSVRVTAAGERMYELSADLLESIAGIADIMRGYASAEQGMLRLTAAGSGAAQLLPRAVAGITSKHPAAEISLVTPGTSDSVVESIKAGFADIGIIYEYSPTSKQVLEGLTSTPLLHEEMVVIGRDQGPSGERSSIRDFAEENWVCGSKGSTQDQILQHLGEREGFVPRIAHRSDDPDVIRGLVNQGLGIALVPVLSLGIDRSIHLYRLTDRPVHRRVQILYRATDHNPLIASAIHAFVKAAGDYLTWTLTAFGVTFDAPMLTLDTELQGN